MNEPRPSAALLVTQRPLPFSRERQVVLWTALIGIGLFGLFSILLFDYGVAYAAAGMALVLLFSMTLIKLEVGIGAALIAMMFSPEVQLAQLSARALTVRLEDLLIPVLFLAWLGRKALGSERGTLRHDPLITLLVVFSSVQFLATVVGWQEGRVQPLSAALYNVKQLQYLGLLYFVFQYVHTLERARLLIKIAVFTAILAALYNVPRIPQTEMWTQDRITAPFEGSPEPTSIGGYFVLILGFVLALAVMTPERKTRLALLAVFVVLFIPLLFTLSRSSYVAFLLMVSCVAALTRDRTLMLTLLLGLAAAPWVLPDIVIERILYTFQDRIKVFGVFDRSFGERLMVWERVAWSMKSAPVLGGGVTYRNIIDSYYARLLIETGVCGLLVFIAICGRLFQVASRVRHLHPTWWARSFAVGYTAALVGLLVQSWSAITFVIIRIMEPFWLATGVLLGLAHQLVESEATATADADDVQSSFSALTDPRGPSRKGEANHG